MKFLSVDEIKYYKKTFKPKTRVRMLSMFAENYPVPYGTCGTVWCVDDLGTIHVEWDNGQTLGICPNVDKFEKI